MKEEELPTEGCHRSTGLLIRAVFKDPTLVRKEDVLDAGESGKRNIPLLSDTLSKTGLHI